MRAWRNHWKQRGDEVQAEDDQEDRSCDGVEVDALSRDEVGPSPPGCRRWSWPPRGQLRDRLLLGGARRQLSADEPRRRCRSVARPRIFGPDWPGGRRCDAGPWHHEDRAHARGAAAQQPRPAEPEVHAGLLGGAPAMCGGPARRALAGPGGPRRPSPPGTAVAHHRSTSRAGRLDDLLGRSCSLQELVVGAEPDDAAVLEHDDLVGVGDGEDPLGDDDHGRRRPSASSAIRSRASVATSSAENESSKR
jgi:hypothetical protein